MVNINRSLENTEVLKGNNEFGVSHLFRLKRYVQSSNSNFAGAEAVVTTPKRRNVFKEVKTNLVA